MTGRLILWLCIIWLVPLMYVMLRNETKFKKNIVLGVTLPYQGRTDPEVMTLLARFKTVAAVRAASISDLEEVKGISHAKAEQIYNALRQ